MALSSWTGSLQSQMKARMDKSKAGIAVLPLLAAINHYRTTEYAVQSHTTTLKTLSKKKNGITSMLSHNHNLNFSSYIYSELSFLHVFFIWNGKQKKKKAELQHHFLLTAKGIKEEAGKISIHIAFLLCYLVLILKIPLSRKPKITKTPAMYCYSSRSCRNLLVLKVTIFRKHRR